MNLVKFISKAGKAGSSDLRRGLKIKSRKKQRVIHSKEYKDLSKQIKALKSKKQNP
jgi:hypothetical protein